MTGKRRIMVVDDETIVGKRLKRLFEKSGFDVEIFTESSAAVENIKKKTFDIIITDLRMEGIDGIEILETAKEINPDIQVIIITGCVRRKRRVEALEKGALDFITKPFKIADLKKAVQKAEIKLMKKRDTETPSIKKHTSPKPTQ